MHSVHLFHLAIVVPAAVALASLALLLHAVRGRRVDDHPICRRCGFDLYGKPKGVTVCSECGTDLRRKRSVRAGRRQTRQRLLFTSVPLLLLSAGWLGLLGWGASRGINWNRHKPVWLLMREARAADTVARDSALIEMTSRMADGKLSQWQTDALVDSALEIQSDPRRPWTAPVGDVLQRTHAAGKLSDARRRRFASQAAALELRSRTTVRRGEPLVYSPTIEHRRLARGDWFMVDYEIVDTQIGGVSIDTHRGVRHGATTLRPGEPFPGPTFLPPMDETSLAALADGKHVLRVTVRVMVWEYTGRWPHPAGELLVDEQRELAARVELVPADAVTVKLNRDESLRPAVERMLEVTYRHAHESNANKPGVVVDCSQPPVDLAYQVLLRSRDGREWKLGDVQFEVAPPGGAVPPREVMALSKVMAKWRAAPNPIVQADLVLRPSVQAAVRTVNMTEIWAGEVIFQGVDLYDTSMTFDLLAVHRPGTRPSTQPLAPVPR